MLKLGDKWLSLNKKCVSDDKGSLRNTFLFKREFQHQTLFPKIHFCQWHLRWQHYQSQVLSTAKAAVSLLPLQACWAIYPSPQSAAASQKIAFASFQPYLQIGPIIFGYVGTVALTQHGDFLLNVLYLIFCLFQVNDFYGDHFLSPIVNAFEHLTKRALPDFLQFGEKLLWIRF